ncbi:hypothetical protein FNH63_04410 [Salmonella enterica subsp. salamae]|nr:hypothetical protein [Salmonella enterica]ECJ5916802.1 hypothetical protein [Salmonella enterica subsp. salamae]HCM1832870.1 hypothetical protein [Salmonella enterica subsp. salamae serovar 48:z81:z39]ECW0040856.1 hypothetical protein [Salmonella enterica]EDX9487144.1 hypothetical protein [Salmonella enterica]
MPDYYKHIFLVPLKEVSYDLLNTIKGLSCYKSQQFGFIVSVQDMDSYEYCLAFFHSNHNIHVINPDQKYNRTHHWGYVIQRAKENIIFDSFSYYFSGDEINLDQFPNITCQHDIYINDYYIDSWENVKENVSAKQLASKSFTYVLKKNFLFGKPMLAPLQKIIFSRSMAGSIFFDSLHSYVSDQLMIHRLINDGAKAKFIKQPFYRLNKKSRAFSNRISLIDMLKQQIYLYTKIRCFAGTPMIVLRTIVKHIFYRTY